MGTVIETAIEGEPAMEPDVTPGEDTQPIEYEAPRIAERVEIEANLFIVPS